MAKIFRAAMACATLLAGVLCGYTLNGCASTPPKPAPAQTESAALHALATQPGYPRLKQILQKPLLISTQTNAGPTAYLATLEMTIDKSENMNAHAIRCVLGRDRDKLAMLIAGSDFAGAMTYVDEGRGLMIDATHPGKLLDLPNENPKLIFAGNDTNDGVITNFGLDAEPQIQIDLGAILRSTLPKITSLTDDPVAHKLTIHTGNSDVWLRYDLDAPWSISEFFAQTHGASVDLTLVTGTPPAEMFVGADAAGALFPVENIEPFDLTSLYQSVMALLRGVPSPDPQILSLSEKLNPLFPHISPKNFGTATQPLGPIY
ncbi:MAG TPA: hypothetical protein VH253_01565 [Phycisphaerae bacterium]|nr:hypothetical protein [Phycisphaerae bacterium]